MAIVAAILSIVLGLLQLVLGLRIVGVFFGLTSADGPAIVGAIYRWSEPWVAPFGDLLPRYGLGGFTLDAPAIIAVIAYGVIGGIIIRILRGSSNRSRL